MPGCWATIRSSWRTTSTPPHTDYTTLASGAAGVAEVPRVAMARIKQQIMMTVSVGDQHDQAIADTAAVRMEWRRQPLGLRAGRHQRRQRDTKRREHRTIERNIIPRHRAALDGRPDLDPA